jgi:hypothetical protein
MKHQRHGLRAIDDRINRTDIRCVHNLFFLQYFQASRVARHRKQLQT